MVTRSCFGIMNFIKLFYMLLHLIIQALIGWATESYDVHNINDVEEILVVGEVIEINYLFLVLEELVQPCCIIFVMI